MKLFKQFSFFGLALLLVSTSCTMQKRVYMSGYHIEWNKSKHDTDKKEFANKEIKKQSEQNKIETLHQPKNNTIQLMEKKQITKSQKQKNIFSVQSLNTLINIAKTDTAPVKENVKNKLILNNEDKKLTYSKFAVKGFIFSMLEILILVSIFYAAPYSFTPALIAAFFLFLLFLLFAILAILYSVEGLQQIKKENVKGKSLAIVGLIVVIFPIAVFIIALLI